VKTEERKEIIQPVCHSVVFPMVSACVQRLKAVEMTAKQNLDKLSELSETFLNLCRKP
jgi:hypothetical protein